jgi:nitrogen regulatory protein PII 2
MKEITAIIRMNMMNKTKSALTEIGVDAFYAMEAQGRGKGLVDTRLLEGAKSGYEEAAALLGEKGRTYPKRVLTVVAEDDEVEEIVSKLIEVNQTGKPGDGKIFVMPVPDAARVRTEEKGVKAIQ